MSEETKLRFQIQMIKMSIERWDDEINKIRSKLDEYQTEKSKLTQQLDELEKKYAEKFGE